MYCLRDWWPCLVVVCHVSVCVSVWLLYTGGGIYVNKISSHHWWPISGPLRRRSRLIFWVVASLVLGTETTTTHIYKYVNMSIWLCQYGYVNMVMLIWLCHYGYVNMVVSIWLCKYNYYMVCVIGRFRSHLVVWAVVFVLDRFLDLNTILEELFSHFVKCWRGDDVVFSVRVYFYVCGWMSCDG